MLRRKVFFRVATAVDSYLKKRKQLIKTVSGKVEDQRYVIYMLYVNGKILTRNKLLDRATYTYQCVLPKKSGKQKCSSRG